jgi:MazG family protein
VKKRNKKPAIDELLEVMATLRSPQGCPWDREQTHLTLRFHAVEEVYELMDAIEAGDEKEMVEELGDLLLQVIFHCQLAAERGAFDFEQVTKTIVEKLIRRHPHVFGDAEAKSVDAVWAQWEKIKKAEKEGTKHHRPSPFDGIPKHLPALLRTEKLVKKARKAGVLPAVKKAKSGNKKQLAEQLFDLAQQAQTNGWSAEELLRAEAAKREKRWRKQAATSVPSRA